MSSGTATSQNNRHQQTRNPGGDDSWRPRRTSICQSDNGRWERAAYGSVPSGTASSLRVNQQESSRAGRGDNWRPWKKSVSEANENRRKMAIGSSMPYETAPSLHVGLHRSKSPGTGGSWRSQRTTLAKSDAIWDRAASSLFVQQHQTGRPGGDEDWRPWTKSSPKGNQKKRTTAPSLHVESPRKRSPGKKDGSVVFKDVQNGQFKAEPCERIEASGVADNSAYVLKTTRSILGNPTSSGPSGNKYVSASGKPGITPSGLPFLPSLHMKPPSISNTGTNFHQAPEPSTTRREQLIPSSSEFQKDSLCIPVVKNIWKGNFEVQNLSGGDKTFKEFVGHRSVNIHHKALKFCKQLPEVIQFNIYPRHTFWPKKFQTSCPDEGDVAFYFYPENNEESKDRYDYLLKHLQKEDSVLRSQMGDIELLVFPSNVLMVDCQKLKGDYFMWGVLRKLKNRKDCGMADTSQGVPAVAQHPTPTQRHEDQLPKVRDPQNKYKRRKYYGCSEKWKISWGNLGKREDI